MCAVSRGRAQRRPNKPPKTVEAPWAWPKLLPRASNRASRFAWTVSRVLFRPRVAARSVKIIHLGAALPRRSSTLTRIPRLFLRVGLWPDRPQRYPYSSLLREGLASPPVTRLSRVSSYPTISPLPSECEALATPFKPLGLRALFGGIISVALSLGLPRVGVTDFPVLWSPDFPPVHGFCAPATFHPPSAEPKP